ncbi:tRNA uridine-5-carboxymethylaminomethyl(34) synthesis enzyme MnmG [Caproiciproducens sp. CPB-2]|uniref:tRNA uridine-5-carboxymethylaminomethyl(34) synthesis enzyme MnmG n=1 Tax=Caproiciproducens sp. CPB-2 TaxID=3030017 RepID=UPI0023DA2157|nr:tRNA uridine-5-carboxymethylaminomethyl(34) synthesis enzyme MnmG [Caproiciproducens sp. CPB-2]MDF1494740.1 tRNA uridine-5-carboxymethylaminomethyl(34) synthesis enzyme MnmG [Caproiciproducens sp. CPB-2]
MKYDAGNYDVVVIGAGHAGIEAALASARLGCSTCVFTINMDAVGNCPCNPSIGGTAKGHLVREIDALGGEMGKTADEAMLQSRMLNLGKGPAVHSLRAQIDRREYGKIMKRKLETQPDLQLKQAEIVDLERGPDGLWLVTTRMEAVYRAKAVVIATGTYLGGKIYVGDVSYEGGPDGMFPSAFLGAALKKIGLRLRRFKTGTPARVLKSSIDFTGLEVQEGDEPVVPFSYDTLTPLKNRAVCHISWTNDSTKQVILENIGRSPMYSGKIEGVGPRYCPSFEDKIMRFPDKKRHQLFIEPCGMDTEEMYLQGMSSSLPEEVQIAFYRTIKGLEHVEIMRCAYAIEYDCVDPLQMEATLEFQEFPGLYGAGQFNGSSGYEEAAAQGLVAGINAALKVRGREPMILDRAGSYIGTLVDDLITKGVSDPYRMMTSRSEYRLVLRQDNADERLTPTGRKIGLISDERWERFQQKQKQKEQELLRAEKTVLPPSEALNQLLVSHETSPVITGVRLAELIRRPQLNYGILKEVDRDRPDLPAAVFENVEIEIKYEGYIKRQKADIAEMRRLEERRLPAKINYKEIVGLRTEAQEKLQKVMPASVGQASRISGVSPADISVLLIWLARGRGE